MKVAEILEKRGIGAEVTNLRTTIHMNAEVVSGRASVSPIAWLSEPLHKDSHDPF
ncbi:MAG: hypothetical protein V1932_00825 [Chloroflexota bacterium]